MPINDNNMFECHVNQDMEKWAKKLNSQKEALKMEMKRTSEQVKTNAQQAVSAPNIGYSLLEKVSLLLLLFSIPSLSGCHMIAIASWMDVWMDGRMDGWMVRRVDINRQ